jgi:NAD(P)-dependent dehydrogenase (short-subunit alcohol dehydrogenase family)
MGKRFEGKRVFITGASSGIGAATALELARQGARVGLAARRADRLEAVRRQIENLGGQAVTAVCDVKDRASLDAAVARVVEALGGIDLAIANAGFGVTGPFEELGTEGFRRQFDTNVFGVIDTVYAVLPHLAASKGHLAIVSSVLGRVGLPLSSPYCASKSAIYALSECLYYELAPKGVAVTCILPGIVASETRSVDNLGVYHPGSGDTAPKFLIVPTEKAAREIVSKLYKRKFEAVITGHGKIILWLSRHFSGLVRTFVTRMLAKRDLMGRSRKPKAEG